MEIDRGAAIRGVEKRVVVETTVVVWVNVGRHGNTKSVRVRWAVGMTTMVGIKRRCGRRQRSHRPGTEPALPD